MADYESLIGDIRKQLSNLFSEFSKESAKSKRSFVDMNKEISSIERNVKKVKDNFRLSAKSFKEIADSISKQTKSTSIIGKNFNRIDSFTKGFNKKIKESNKLFSSEIPKKRLEQAKKIQGILHDIDNRVKRGKVKLSKEQVKVLKKFDAASKLFLVKAFAENRLSKGSLSILKKTLFFGKKRKKELEKERGILKDQKYAMEGMSRIRVKSKEDMVDSDSDGTKSRGGGNPAADARRKELANKLQRIAGILKSTVMSLPDRPLDGIVQALSGLIETVFDNAIGEIGSAAVDILWDLSSAGHKMVIDSAKGASRYMLGRGQTSGFGFNRMKNLSTSLITGVSQNIYVDPSQLNNVLSEFGARGSSVGGMVQDGSASEAMVTSMISIGQQSTLLGENASETARRWLEVMDSTSRSAQQTDIIMRNLTSSALDAGMGTKRFADIIMQTSEAHAYLRDTTVEHTNILREMAKSGIMTRAQLEKYSDSMKTTEDIFVENFALITSRIGLDQIRDTIEAIGENAVTPEEKEKNQRMLDMLSFIEQGKVWDENVIREIISYMGPAALASGISQTTSGYGSSYEGAMMTMGVSGNKLLNYQMQSYMSSMAASGMPMGNMREAYEWSRQVSYGTQNFAEDAEHVAQINQATMTANQRLQIELADNFTELSSIVDTTKNTVSYMLIKSEELTSLVDDKINDITGRIRDGEISDSVTEAWNSARSYGGSAINSTMGGVNSGVAQGVTRVTQFTFNTVNQNGIPFSNNP